MQPGSDGIFHAGLRRIRRDDFQIAAVSKRKERVLRAAAGMDSAKRCAHARMLFYKINPGLQIGRAEQNVVEQGGHLDCRKELTRGDDCSGCESQKEAARNVRREVHEKSAGIKASATFSAYLTACDKRLVDGARGNFFLQRGDDIGERAWAEVALAAMADADGAGLGFLGADHEHVGNFLHLGVANFRWQLFVAVVEMHANAVVFQGFLNVFRVLRHLFADRADFHLDWRKPEWKCAGVMFDEDSEETLDGAEQRAMDHQRLVARAVFADKFEFESSGKIEVELHGC